MVEKPEPAPLALHTWTESLAAALKAAEADLRSGDAAEAEKRAKAVSAFVKAVRDLTELQAVIAAHTPEEDVERRRAIMGELLWDMWNGPVDRWDEGNVVRIRLYGGTLASMSADAVLSGANAFAIEGGDGAWEIVQARTCVLVAPGEYELSGFLRGLQGTEQAMRAPHPAGARLVKIDARLACLDIAAHEWGDALRFSAPPWGLAANDARAARVEAAPTPAALRPWAPAHLAAKRESSGDVRPACRAGRGSATIGGRATRRLARQRNDIGWKLSTAAMSSARPKRPRRNMSIPRQTRAPISRRRPLRCTFAWLNWTMQARRA